MAIAAGTVWEIRTTGAQTAGGGFVWTSLVSATYRWVASGSGTNEYYCQTAAGGDPSLTASGSVCTDGNYNLATEGTAGSLTAGQYDFADNDALGYTTLYVRLANGLDPDAMIARGQPGYVSYGGGGTDYSQQAAAQLSLTDLATSGAGVTTLTSVTGGFTAAMVNNVIHITSGTNFQAGWYRITVYTNSNTVTLDRTPSSAGAGSLGVGAVGGAFKIGGTLDDDVFEATTAGNQIWIGSGTYTLGEQILVAAAGTTTNKKTGRGYTSVRGDTTLGTDRPLLDCGANYAFGNTGAYWTWKDLRFTGTGSSVISASGSGTQYINLLATNTAGGASTKHAFTTLSNSYIIGCEGSVSGNTGATSSVFYNTANSTFIGCYAHDAPNGWYGGGVNLSLFGCIADTCTTGMDFATNNCNYSAITNCTIHNCTNGVTTGATVYWTNCIISGCTVGVSATSAFSSVGFVNNTMNNTTDFSNITNQIGTIFGDPGLNDPANGDFSVTSADTNVYEQAASVGKFTSAVV